ncbi:hypothetical protein NLJ89_g12379 [Agrocybe chaxingu]|uniref:Uncharacterized protein n=1 Tax=Agrocybe chaxingu TaxID=84603 RepID=A0A9W8JLZ3_9AGAR|nr:hypothetical protein NLJ89_g12379 [Agrocybe chaxingu]
MHLTLAPPDTNGDEEDAARSNGRERSETPRSGHRFGTSTASRRLSMGLAQAGGLVLWPSTFIPMDHFEIEIHASKHLRMLLSCKNFLLEHAIEATDDEEIDEESVMEALWEYESFLRHRFNPPPPSPPPSEPTDPILVDDTASIRGSIAESVCSDNQEAMWEIQSCVPHTNTLPFSRAHD